MVSNTEITNKGLEKAQLRYEQAKQKLAEEMAKAREEKRRAETHHKCVMGGLVAKWITSRPHRRNGGRKVYRVEDKL